MGAEGRDIGRMFRVQEEVLREWRVDDVDVAPDADGDEEGDEGVGSPGAGSNHDPGQNHSPAIRDPDIAMEGETIEGDVNAAAWMRDGEDVEESDAGEEDDVEMMDGEVCEVCGAVIPVFAKVAHERYHSLPDS